VPYFRVHRSFYRLLQLQGALSNQNDQLLLDCAYAPSPVPAMHVSSPRHSRALTAQLLALTGVPGSGKSELAKHYMWHRAHHLSSMGRRVCCWWFNAERSTSLRDDHDRLCALFHITAPESAEDPQAWKHRALQVKLRKEHLHCVFTFDNAPGLDAVRSLMITEAGLSAEILITTHDNSIFASMIGVNSNTCALALDGGLDMDEAVALLSEHSGISPPVQLSSSFDNAAGRSKAAGTDSSGSTPLESVINALDRLPLGLVTAGLYVRQRRVRDPAYGFAEYLAELSAVDVSGADAAAFESELHQQLLSVQAQDYRKSQGRALQMAIQQVEPAYRLLLNFVTWCQPDKIPSLLLHALFRHHIVSEFSGDAAASYQAHLSNIGALQFVSPVPAADEAAALLAKSARHPTECDAEFLGLLSRSSNFLLFSWDADKQLFQLHRSTQAVLRISLAKEERTQLSQRSAAGSSTSEEHRLCQLLASIWLTFPIDPQRRETVVRFSWIAPHLLELFLSVTLLRVLKMSAQQQALGRGLLAHCERLCMFLAFNYNLVSAPPLLLRAEEIGQLVGQDYSSFIFYRGRVAQALSHFADCLVHYKEAGRVANAHGNLRIAVRSLLGIAWVHHRRGEYEQALADYADAASALTTQNNAAPDEIILSECMEGMGNIENARGQWLSAAVQHAEAARLRARIFAAGSVNQWVAASSNNQAITAHGQGRLEEASTGIQHALALYEELYDPTTCPAVAICCSNLADVLCSQGRYNAALQGHARALKIADKCWGEAHPQTALIRMKHSIDLVLLSPSALELPPSGCLACLRTSLTLLQQHLGDAHPDVALARAFLACVLVVDAAASWHTRLASLERTADQLRQALRHLQQASCIRREVGFADDAVTSDQRNVDAVQQLLTLLQHSPHLLDAALLSAARSVRTLHSFNGFEQQQHLPPSAANSVTGAAMQNGSAASSLTLPRAMLLFAHLRHPSPVIRTNHL
jgi:tetratricopeptide (TPR) repeat protein